MYRIALCENNPSDSKWMRNSLVEVFASFGKAYALAEYSSGESFLNQMRPFAFDIVLFDVEMGHISGIEAARRLREIDKSVIIIFTTGHPENVFSSFSAEPLQYLLKPIKPDQLLSAMEKAISKIDDVERQRYVVTFNGVVHSLPLEEILYFESNRRVVEARTAENHYAFYGRLDAVEDDSRLSAFIRCHQSFLVNPAHIKRIGKDEVVLSTGEEIPVSRGKIREVKDQFMRYVAALVP